MARALGLTGEGQARCVTHRPWTRRDISVASSAQTPCWLLSLSGSVERVVVGVGEGRGELVHRQGGRLVVGPRPVRVDGDGDGVGERRGVLGQVRVLAYRVAWVP